MGEHLMARRGAQPALVLGWSCRTCGAEVHDEDAQCAGCALAEFDADRAVAWELARFELVSLIEQDAGVLNALLAENSGSGETRAAVVAARGRQEWEFVEAECWQLHGDARSRRFAAWMLRRKRGMRPMRWVESWWLEDADDVWDACAELVPVFDWPPAPPVVDVVVGERYL